MSQAYAFSFTFDHVFIRDALRRDWVWRYWLLAVAVAAIGGFIAWRSDDPAVYASAFGVATIFTWALGKYGFSCLVDRTFRMWSLQAPSHTVTLRLDDEGFAVEMENGSARYAWGSLRRLWRYPDVWAFEIIKMQSVIFPPDAAPVEVQEFIVERCRAAEVRVS